MSDIRQPTQLCEDESTLFGQFSRMYFTGLAALPWRTQLISGALPLNLHVRPLVTSLSGPRRTELQALLWPHIVHRYNVIFIDNPLFAPEPPPFYDNTMDSGFVVPMLLRIAESCGRRHLAQLYNEGPLAIVVVSTLEESLSLVESIKTAAMQFDRDFRIVNVYEMPEEKEFQEKSYMTAESCDVLVVALHSIMTLFATQGRLWSPPINLLKVELVVFRNVDVMLRVNQTVVEQALNRFLVNPDINYVFAASAPSIAMKKIVGKLENIVCTVIANYFDAVIYEKLPIQLVDTSTKIPWSMSALKTFEDRPPGQRIILFVGTDKHAAELKRTLELPRKMKTHGYDFMSVSENESVYDSISTIRDWWKSDTKEQVRILCIPEKFTGDFGITDADLIVHLSPPSSVQQFMKRFFCIKKTFMTWASAYQTLSKSFGEKPPLPPISCKIVVDEAWKPMLPMLVQMASAAGEHSVIPKPILDASTKVLQTPAFLRVPPCLHQLYTGDCMRKGSCSARHYPGPKSPMASMLLSDTCNRFEFRLLRFLNPAHFIARVVRTHQPDGMGVSYERIQKDLDERLDNIREELPEPYTTIPGPDVICGMMANDSTKLHRVQILKTIDKDNLHIFYMDEGIGMSYLPDDRRHPKCPARVKVTTKFYPLPEEVTSVERTWVNVILARVLPSAQERSWRPSVAATVYTAIKNHIYEEKTVMEAKGLFCSEDFVFVDNFKAHKIQEGRNTITVSMHNILTRYSKFGHNTGHLEKLQKSFEAESAARGQSMTSLLPMYQPSPTDKMDTAQLPPIPQEAEEVLID